MKSSLMEISNSWDGSLANVKQTVTLTPCTLLKLEASSIPGHTDAQINKHISYW